MDIVEGGLYALPAKGGGWSVAKVLKVDDGGVHVRLYSNEFGNRPDKIDESKLYMAGMKRGPLEALGIGHMPIRRDGFVAWKPQLIQRSNVSAEELEGYQEWSEANGGYF